MGVATSRSMGVTEKYIIKTWQMCLCWASSCIRMHYSAPSLNNTPYFSLDMQRNLELLGNGTASVARQHVKVTQTKGAVECAGNFPCFVCAWLDLLRPAVWQRWLCGGRIPDLVHLPVPSIRCFPFFFFFSCAAETAGVYASSGWGADLHGASTS